MLRNIPKAAPSQRSSEREALAVAIARHAELTSAAKAIPGAIMTARTAIREAEEEVLRASAAIEAAKASGPRYLVDVSLGRIGDAPPSMRDARAALVDAEDRLEAAQAARASLDAYSREIEEASLFSRMAVEAAITTVIRSETSGLVVKMAQRHVAMRRELAIHRQALEFVISRSGIRELPAGASAWNVTFLPFPDLPVDPWKTWETALATDPDAAMP